MDMPTGRAAPAVMDMPTVSDGYAHRQGATFARVIALRVVFYI